MKRRPKATSIATLLVAGLLLAFSQGRWAVPLCAWLAPIFLIRRGRHKFITSTGDPDLLFDLEADPDEVNNLASDPVDADLVAEFAKEAASLWNSEALSLDIIKSQQRRLLIKRAHSKGAKTSWELTPAGEDTSKWFRGQRNYNEWALDILKPV